MPTKIGTLAFGTYAHGPGLTGQCHLIFAQAAKVWWFFCITSAQDTTGIPGVHVLKSYYSSSANLFTATWTASTDSPNFDAPANNSFAKIESGRGFGCVYWWNGGGTKKDIVLFSAAMQNADKLTGGDSVMGVIRASVTATTITWDAWAGYNTPNWNNVAGHTFQAGSIIGRTSDGYVQFASMYIHSEVDAGAVTSLDPDMGDNWTTGSMGASGSLTSGSAVITGMTNQTRLKVGMALSSNANDWNVCRYPRVISIDSSTQVTMSHTATNAGTGSLGWWQGTGGSNRLQADTPMVDVSMTNECQCFGFAPLDNGGMLIVYDSGAQVPPNFSELASIKANQTQAQGFWPATSGTGVAVFGSSVTNDIQDWCLIPVDTTHIYCARRTANTTIAVRKYNTGSDTWSALATQPPALTGKVIKAGGGVVGITNNYDFWLFVINSTDNVISCIKYNEVYDTWGAWTTVSAVDSTASKMSCSPILGPISGVTSQAGLIYQVTNGGSFDAYVAPFLVGDPPDWDGIINRPEPQQLRRAGLAAGVR